MHIGLIGGIGVAATVACCEPLTSGICTDAQRQTFFDAGRDVIGIQGADAIILAGTDLDLAYGGHDPGYPVVDALDVHLNVLADLASGRTTLNDLNAGQTL